MKNQVLAIALVIVIGLAVLMTCAWTLQGVEPLELSLESSFTQDVCAVDGEFIEMLMAQIVCIQNESGTGSGVVIDSECGLILTAAHGQCDELTSYICLNDGRLIAITLKKSQGEGISFGLPIRYLVEAREEAD